MTGRTALMSDEMVWNSDKGSGPSGVLVFTACGGPFAQLFLGGVCLQSQWDGMKLCVRSVMVGSRVAFLLPSSFFEVGFVVSSTGRRFLCGIFFPGARIGLGFLSRLLYDLRHFAGGVACSLL